MVSGVDLFPTIVESCGGHLDDTDRDLPGVSLFHASRAADAERAGFAEYHAVASNNASFMWREGNWKLIYHVGAPPQLFNLKDDPLESHDFVAQGTHLDKANALEARLRAFMEPEEADRRAKQAQQAKAMEFGGNEAIRKRGIFPYSPPPGVEAQIYPTK